MQCAVFMALHPFYSLLYKWTNRLCFYRCLFNRENRHVTSFFTSHFKFYSTVYQGIECVITSHTDVLARVELSSSLTNDDIACFADLTTEYFHA